MILPAVIEDAGALTLTNAAVFDGNPNWREVEVHVLVEDGLLILEHGLLL